MYGCSSTEVHDNIVGGGGPTTVAPYTHAVVIASTQDAEKLKKYNSEFLNNYYANAKIPTWAL